MVTIREVAKEAGVSVGTVSRAFNGYQDIKLETREKVLKVAKKLGYLPNVNAKSLSSKHSSNIGLIVSGFMESDRRNDFVMLILKGTYRYAHEHDLEVALYTLDAEKQRINTYEQFCAQHNIFGAVLSGVATDEMYFNQLVQSGMPCVVIDAYIKGKGLGCVSIDNVKAAEEMTNYLIDAGHRDIIIVEGKRTAEVNNYRLAGVYAAFEKHGMEFSRQQILTGEFHESIAYRQVKEYLSGNGKNDATAFMCFSDIMALGAMKAITELGYSVPDDFSVTGFDGIPIAGYTTPALTTIGQNMEQIGYQAAVLLQELTQNPDESRCVYVPYHFLERKSVKKIQVQK